jgi:hypothetical protein
MTKKKVKCDKRIKDKNMSNGKALAVYVCQNSPQRSMYNDANPHILALTTIKWNTLVVLLSFNAFCFQVEAVSWICSPVSKTVSTFQSCRIQDV